MFPTSKICTIKIGTSTVITTYWERSRKQNFSELWTCPGSLWRCIQGLIWSLPTRSSSGRRVDEDRWCRSPQLGFYNLPTARIISLEQSSSSPPDSPSDSPSIRRSNIRSLYRVAHIRCHLSGSASPSRTISNRRLDSLSAVRTYFVEGEKEWQIIAMPCGEKLEWVGELLSSSFYSEGKG